MVSRHKKLRSISAFKNTRTAGSPEPLRQTNKNKKNKKNFFCFCTLIRAHFVSFLACAYRLLPPLESRNNPNLVRAFARRELETVCLSSTNGLLFSPQIYGLRFSRPCRPHFLAVRSRQGSRFYFHRVVVYLFFFSPLISIKIT